MNRHQVIVFDLDDTLFQEVDFLKSAYRKISKELEAKAGQNIYDEMFRLWENGESTFDVIKERYSLSMSIEEMVELYRFHTPDIKCNEGVENVLNYLFEQQIPIGLITDGRSKSQRNKLEALGITKYFEHIVISEEIGNEKPCASNFSFFEDAYPGYSHFTYIGDNTKKDFVAPNQLGWRTICLIDRGNNIHAQDFDMDESYLPQIRFDSFLDLLNIL